MRGFGRLAAAPAVLDAVPRPELLAAFRRHMRRDWGEVCEADWKENDWALKNGERLLSSHCTENGTKRDRSYTTILLPSDY